MENHEAWSQACEDKQNVFTSKTMSAKAELREFLKNTGRDVGRDVGDHLAGMAKDRAVAQHWAMGDPGVYSVFDESAPSWI